MPPAIRHGIAYKHPIRRVKTSVSMPARERFDTNETYYSTLFHELIHSTGHEYV